MCRLHRTDELHQALTDVVEGRIVYRRGRTGPAIGFYWAGTEAHPSATEMSALYDLYHARLIGITEPLSPRGLENLVLATGEGRDRLAEWADHHHTTTHH